MTSRNIIVTDFSGGPAVEYSPEEFLIYQREAAANGFGSVAEMLEAALVEFVARRERIIVDFAPLVNETPASAL
jgi:hypothetical protein